MNRQTVQLGLAIISVALLSGCITSVTTPSYSRSGDLIQVGLGGVKRNSTGKALVGADLSVTITDANSIVHNLLVVGLFRVYPDHASWYARDAQDRADAFFGNVEPYDGMWWATLKLVDKVDGVTPLPLAVGAATISITSTELIDTGWRRRARWQVFPSRS